MNELDKFCPPPRLAATPRQVERVSCSTWMHSGRQRPQPFRFGPSEGIQRWLT